MDISSGSFLTELKISRWIVAARPKTLPAGMAPVILGSALAMQSGAFQIIPSILCLLFSLLVQIGCNYANDYYDYMNGVDTEERIGFARMVSTGQIAPKSMQQAAFLVLLIAFVMGCGLIYYGGWWLLSIGLISIICAVAYTGGPFPLGYYGLGDLFVFIFYGLVAVMFTFYVQTHYFSASALWVGIGCGFLAANIRLVNDTRDKDTDAKAGKKTSAVRFGYKFCHLQYVVSTFIAYCVVPFILATQLGFNRWVLLPLLVALFSVRITYDFLRAKTGLVYNDLLAKSAKILLAYAVVLSIGIVLNK